jgi:hypothetical protein
VALLVGSLAAVAPARAQPVPEPIPLAPGTVPAGGPPTSPYLGPLPPQAAPHGPPDCMVLPPSIPGAFTDCPPEEDTGTYFYLGGLGMQRQRPSHGSVAVIDRLNPSPLDTGIRPVAERFLTEELNFHNVSPSMNGAIEGTIGYMWGGNALELTGFYLPQASSSISVAQAGRLDLPFLNPPLGFEGDNGLWLQADVARITLKQSMGNAEFNYRWWNQAVTGVEGIFGIRYTDLDERMSIFTGDDDLTVLDINGNPDPHRQATYTVTAHNHIAAPQLGFEWHVPVCSFISFSAMGKGAWGIDYVDLHYRLVRGDGFVGRDVRRFHTDFAQEYEVGFYLDFWLFERGRLRAGYNLYVLADVLEAGPQVNYNLANQKSKPFQDGSIFYHGPLIELQLLF